MPGGVHFLDPFCYRCPFGQKKESCARECIKHLEEVIRYEGPDKIAAIIMEGVVGSNGLIVPPVITGRACARFAINTASCSSPMR